MEKQQFYLGFVSALLVAVIFISGCTTETEYQPGTPSGGEKQTETKSASEEKIKILDHEMVRGEFGNLMVVGTAENVGDKQLSYAEIRVRFYDKDDVLLETFMDNINDVGPGQKWRFEVMYPGMDTQKVDHYDIGVGTVW
ncbi:MAG: hypothetical protein A7315_14010 [Candidatus Altiarchaeales archaeon WOR_SM1_79]|nr:MAG: hypothetical protein A7315_14010 [Candidatus Altiarchaeales archaeon WOR_SM1_79]